jgi:hypothetical protein
MARSIDISQIGGTLVNGGSGGGGGTAPGNVSGITVTGILDPVALTISLQVTFTPPGGAFTGVHIWLDIPDHGDSSTTQTVGVTPLGTGVIAGPFNPIDLGIQTNPQQPWNLSTAFPSWTGLNPKQDIVCRLYIASVNAAVGNPLIQDGKPNATPNLSFTLVSLASGSPTAATNVTDFPTSLTLVCDVLENQTVSGKLVTPVSALIGAVPSNPPTGWGYKLIGVQAGLDATSAANQQVLTGVETTAGIVPPPPSGDGVSTQHSFVMQTPTALTEYTVFVVTGLYLNGAWSPNNIVPGITPSCPITIGTTTGVIDASQAIQSSISAEMQVYLGKLGLTPRGVGAGFLASGAAQTNLGVVSATTIISANTITGSLMATTGIITASAQIGNGVVGDLQIGSCNVSKLTAGSASFSGTVTFANSSGPSVVISSTQVEITGGTYTIAANSSSGISISSSGASLALTSSALTITSGSYAASFTSSEILLSYGGGYPQVAIFSNSVYISQSLNDYVEISSGTITIVANGVSSTVTNSGLTTPTVTCAALQCSGLNLENYAGTTVQTRTSAVAGSYTPPSAVALYLEVEVLGTVYLMPLYNI